MGSQKGFIMKRRVMLLGLTTLLPMATLTAGAQDAEPATTPRVVPTTKPKTIAVPVKDTQLIDKLKAAGANLSPQVIEIVRMSEAGADATVIQAYVENSTVAHNPRAEEIIYLHDHGIPNSVITAMIQRAAKLREQPPTAQASAEPASPPPPAESPSYAVQQPAPVYVTSQPTYIYYPSYPSYYSYPGYYSCWPYPSFGLYFSRPYYYGHSFYGHGFVGGRHFGSFSHFHHR